jgi:hypothetical protein
MCLLAPSGRSRKRRGSKSPTSSEITLATWARSWWSINQQHPTMNLLGCHHTLCDHSSTKVRTSHEQHASQHHRLHRFHGTIHEFLHIGECGCGKVPRPRPHPVSSCQTSQTHRLPALISSHIAFTSDSFRSSVGVFAVALDGILPGRAYPGRIQVMAKSYPGISGGPLAVLAWARQASRPTTTIFP